MRVAIRVLALTAIGAAAFGPAVHAQDMTTATFGGTTIWVGGGVQFVGIDAHVPSIAALVLPGAAAVGGDQRAGTDFASGDHR